MNALQDEVSRLKTENLQQVIGIQESFENIKKQLIPSIELSENAITSVFQDGKKQNPTGEPDTSGEEASSNLRFENASQPESAPEVQSGKIEAEIVTEKVIPFQGKELVTAQNTEPQDSSPIIKPPPP